MESSWKEVATKIFERNLKYLEQKERNLGPSALILHPFLKVLPTEQYVNIILQEIKSLSDNSRSFTLPLSVLNANIGLLVYREYEVCALFLLYEYKYNKFLICLC